MAKVVKVYLLCKTKNKDGDEVSYSDINRILWNLQKDTRTIKNKAVQLCWEWNNYQSDYNDIKAVYPKDKDILGYTLNGFLYDNLKSIGKLYSGNSTTSMNDASASFKRNKLSYLKGEKSIMNYNRDQPLDLHNKAINLEYTDNHFYLTLSLLNQAGMKEYNISRFRFECIVKDNSTKTILERCFDGIYKISASKLIYDKKKKMWKINLCYLFENVPAEGLDQDKILGVDLGVSKPIVASICGELKRFIIHEEEIDQFRKKVEHRKKGLLRQTKYCGDGRIGHGRNTRCKPAYDISDKIARFRDTANHKYSRALIDYAVKNNCGTIQLEDLSGIADGSDVYLKNWSYYDLQQKIEYKAKEKGIAVVKINPRYTSRRCSKCGYIDKDNRTTQERFSCLSCGFTENADYNASQNISVKDIDKVIDAWIKEN